MSADFLIFVMKVEKVECILNSHVLIYVIIRLVNIVFKILVKIYY